MMALASLPIFPLTKSPFFVRIEPNLDMGHLSIGIFAAYSVRQGSIPLPLWYFEYYMLNSQHTECLITSGPEVTIKDPMVLLTTLCSSARFSFVSAIHFIF